MRHAGAALGSLVAFLFTALAVASVDTPAAATGFAAAAVAAAGMVVLSLLLPPGSLIAPAPAASTAGRTSVREWFRSGDLGREEVVRLLDLIDRMGAHPNLSVRPLEEIDAIRGLSHRDFVALVDRRLDEIEGAS
jgi:hypothetical protein